MWRNYLKVGLRNLKRQKGYALINIAGLAVGVAVCLLLLLFVRNELSYDRFHEKSERIFRVLYEGLRPPQGDNPPQVVHAAQTSMLLGPLLDKSLPEVKRVVRLKRTEGTVTVNGEPFLEELLFVDSTFFDVFDFPLRSGNAKTVLRQPNIIVLSAEAAAKYFEENPMGKELSIRHMDTTHVMTVGGVAKPLPPNSSITFSILLPFSECEAFNCAVPNWGTISPQTFVELAAPASKEVVEEKLPRFIEQHVPENMPPSKLDFQPLTEIHFSRIVEREQLPTSRAVYTYILAGIAGFILLIACINFTTLAIGRSARRSREVGMRKALGARRMQLAGQFWGEAVLVVLASAAVGLILAFLFLPVFNSLVGKELTLFAFAPWSTIAMIGGLILFVSLLAGSYPAFFLSRFNPVRVFRGQVGLGGKHRLMRSLVAVQFGLSIFLITGTLFMNQQLELLLTKDLGFDKEQVVKLEVPFREGERTFQLLKNELADEPGVAGLAGTWNTIVTEKGVGFENDFSVQAGSLSVTARAFGVTNGIVETLGLELRSGVSFEEVEGREGVIVNESLAEAFGWERASGHFVEVHVPRKKQLPVVGVARDFNYRSLRHEVEPMYLFQGAPISNIYVRFAKGSLPASLDMLRRSWQKVAPDVAFQYEFLDEAVEESYRSVQQWTWIIGYGSLFAIAVACLGVFGLVTLSTERRRKEIGIRKVLGASAARIVGLLSKDFARLVVAGFAIAVPLTYFAVRRWLQDFAYRIDIDPWTFAGAGLLAGAVSMAAVAYQAIKAALTNPIDTIRYE